MLWLVRVALSDVWLVRAALSNVTSGLVRVALSDVRAGQGYTV